MTPYIAVISFVLGVVGVYLGVEHGKQRLAYLLTACGVGLPYVYLVYSLNHFHG